MFRCERCTLLFNRLNTISRYDDSGRISLFTRVCDGCSKASGLLPDRYSVTEDSVEIIQEVEPEELYTSPAEVDEALELQIK